MSLKCSQRADNFDEWSQGYLDGFDGKDAAMSTPSYEQGCCAKAALKVAAPINDFNDPVSMTVDNDDSKDAVHPRVHKNQALGRAMDNSRPARRDFYQRAEGRAMGNQWLPTLNLKHWK